MWFLVGCIGLTLLQISVLISFERDFAIGTYNRCCCLDVQLASIPTVFVVRQKKCQAVSNIEQFLSDDEILMDSDTMP